MKDIVINLDFIKSLEPCEEGLDNYIKHHSDFQGSVIDFLALDNVPVDDKLWVVLRDEVLDEELMHRFAISCAYSCLHHYEDMYPNDKRPRQAIEAKEKYLRGEISSKELSAARSAAKSAESTALSVAKSYVESAEYTVWSAAKSAEAATWSTVKSADWSATRSDMSAAWSAECAAGSIFYKEDDKRLNRLIEIITDNRIN